MRTQSLRLGALLAAAGWACGGGDTTDPLAPLRCSSTTEPLQRGEVAVLSSRYVNQCAYLADEAGAQYLVVPFTTNFEQSLNVVVTVEGSWVSFDGSAAPSATMTGAHAAHAALRRLEAELAALGLPAASPVGDARLFAPTVGQVDSFWVIQNIDDIDTSAVASDFQRVGATLKFIGARTLLYMDDESPGPDTLTQAEIEEMGGIFDERLYPLGTQTFGNPSDVDNNGKVTILLTPYVNALTLDTATGVIVGFFFAVDLHSPGTLGCGTLCNFSNQQEIFYGMVPDADGVFSASQAKDVVKSILPPVMIHEFQHMISYNQRVLVRRGFPEVLWLNEGLSHIAEELGGDIFADQDSARAAEYYEQNFLRSERYLEQPWNWSLTVTSGSGTLEERGAGWLFLRWLGDRYTNDVYGRLVRATDLGSVNVERRANTDFFFLFGDWLVTLYSDDLAIEGLSDRYQIDKWDLRSYPWAGGGYPLQPVVRTFSQIRSGGVTQTLKGSSPYHILVSADGSGDLTLGLDVGTEGGGLALLRTQ